jgi:hypothetical protein
MTDPYFNVTYAWCTAKFMKLGVNCTTVVSFTRRTNKLAFEYRFCESCINRADSIKDLGAIVGSTLYFYHQVDYVFSQAAKLLGFFHTLAFSCFPPQSLFILHFTLITSKLQ